MGENEEEPDGVRVVEQVPPRDGERPGLCREDLGGLPPRHEGKGPHCGCCHSTLGKLLRSCSSTAPGQGPRSRWRSSPAPARMPASCPLRARLSAWHSFSLP